MLDDSISIAINQPKRLDINMENGEWLEQAIPLLLEGKIPATI